MGHPVPEVHGARQHGWSSSVTGPRQSIKRSGQAGWGRGWWVELGKASGREELRLGGATLRKAVDGNRRRHGGRAGGLDGRGRMTRPDAVALGLVPRNARTVPVAVGTVMVAHRRRGTGMQRLHRPPSQAWGEQQQEQRNESSTLDAGRHGPKLRGPPPPAKRAPPSPRGGDPRSSLPYEGLHAHPRSGRCRPHPHARGLWRQPSARCGHPSIPR